MLAKGHFLNQSILARTGDAVRYVARADNRHDLFDASQNALRHLRKGGRYTVRQTYHYDDYTFVELAEYPGMLFYSYDFVPDIIEETEAQMA